MSEILPPLNNPESPRVNQDSPFVTKEDLLAFAKLKGYADAEVIVKNTYGQLSENALRVDISDPESYTPPHESVLELERLSPPLMEVIAHNGGRVTSCGLDKATLLHFRESERRLANNGRIYGLDMRPDSIEYSLLADYRNYCRPGEEPITPQRYRSPEHEYSVGRSEYLKRLEKDPVDQLLERKTYSQIVDEQEERERSLDLLVVRAPKIITHILYGQREARTAPKEIREIDSGVRAALIAMAEWYGAQKPNNYGEAQENNGFVCAYDRTKMVDVRIVPLYFIGMIKHFDRDSRETPEDVLPYVEHLSQYAKDLERLLDPDSLEGAPRYLGEHEEGELVSIKASILRA